MSVDGNGLREYIKGMVAEVLSSLEEDEINEFSGGGAGGGNTVASAMGGSSLGGHMGMGTVVKKNRKKAKKTRKS